MSAHVLLNLLNELGKRDKMRGLPNICRAFYLFSATSLINSIIQEHECHTQGAEVTGQLRVNGKVRHLRRCTLEDQALALKRKHRVHKYVNTAIICVSVMKLFILT